MVCHLIAWLLAIIVTIYNVYGSRTLAGVSSFACAPFPLRLMISVFWNHGSFVIISVVLLAATSPKQRAKFIFIECFNNTGWENTYLSITFLTLVILFIIPADLRSSVFGLLH